MGTLRLFASAALMTALAAHPLAAADRGVLRDRCWSPALLTGPASEKKIVRGDKRFDAPPLVTQLAPFTPVAEPLRGAIRRVKLPPGKKLVALTFDMCELPGEVTGYDAALVDVLRANNAKATFFAGGKWMRSHPVRTRQLMADPLFELANHAEAHRNLRLLSGPELTAEIIGPQIAYERTRAELAATQCVRGQEDALRTVPERMSMFRFPFGACHQAALDAVNDAGLLAIQWNLSLGDPTPAQTAEAIHRALMAVKPGSIVIGHGNGRGFHTSQALVTALPALRDKGFEFVTVSELLAQGTPEISGTCYDTRPGDTDKYDTFFKPRQPKPAAPRTEPPHEPSPLPR